MGKIILDGVEKSFGEVKVIKGVDLEIVDGEFVVFVGPSGCGKSTLLRMICGLEELTSGKIFVGETDVSDLAPSERQLAMVFQSYALYPHMTVRGNIGFGLRIAGFDKETINRKVLEAAKTLEIEHLLDRRPRDLSGGQRQRVAIGRAIVRSPKAFLFDEPLSNLDAALRVQMRKELISLHEDIKTTMIYVTHDQVEAMTMADRIVVLKDGAIMQVDRPAELYQHPQNEFVAGFIGSPKMNFITTVGSGDTLELEGGASLTYSHISSEKCSRAAKLGVRPEHFDLSTENGIWKGKVVMGEEHGSERFYQVQVEGLAQIIEVRDIGTQSYAKGDPIWLSPQVEQSFIFDAQGNTIY